MPKQVQLRKGTTAEHATFTGAEGEVTVDTSKDTAVVHDGATAGGHPLAKTDNPTFTGAVNLANTANLSLQRRDDTGITTVGNATLDPGAATFVRLGSLAGAPTIVGISGGTDGRVLVLYNSDTTYGVTIADESTAEGTPANRIKTLTGANSTIVGPGAAMFIYDTNESRWLMINIRS